MKNKPTIITFNNTHYRVMKQDGGSIFSNILPVLTKVASKIAPTVTKTILPGLATCALSALSSLGIDSLLNGKGIDTQTGDIIKAMALIHRELGKLNKYKKQKFDKIMMTFNGQSQPAGVLGTLLASIGISMILKAITGSELHNTPNGYYKTHPKKIPIAQKQPVGQQPEGTALINNKWHLYEPDNPGFHNEYEIQGTQG